MKKLVIEVPDDFENDDSQYIIIHEGYTKGQITILEDHVAVPVDELEEMKSKLVDLLIRIGVEVRMKKIVIEVPDDYDIEAYGIFIKDKMNLYSCRTNIVKDHTAVEDKELERLQERDKRLSEPGEAGINGI